MNSVRSYIESEKSVLTVYPPRLFLSYLRNDWTKIKFLKYIAEKYDGNFSLNSFLNESSMIIEIPILYESASIFSVDNVSSLLTKQLILQSIVITDTYESLEYIKDLPIDVIDSGIVIGWLKLVQPYKKLSPIEVILFGIVKGWLKLVQPYKKLSPIPFTGKLL